MIKVIKTNNEIQIIGHAGYAEYGKDIICCAVSTMEDYTVALFKKLDINFSFDESSGYSKIITDDGLGVEILNTLYESLKELSNDYSNYIKVEE